MKKRALSYLEGHKLVVRFRSPSVHLDTRLSSKGQELDSMKIHYDLIEQYEYRRFR
jgi:hypothetical protein